LSNLSKGKENRSPVSWYHPVFPFNLRRKKTCSPKTVPLDYNGLIKQSKVILNSAALTAMA